ncbi:MAG: SCP2 sterol-binding domain-containing protein [Candidatus Lokiarchaeota archaeon]|nr:SCP2 sterol-binding domain-containing protein [Candidatus Lokiarchaeota archaeon]
MAGQNPINSILRNLDKDSPKFEYVLDKIIKAVVKIMNNTEELNEELVGFDDIYQTNVVDANFNYWLEVSDEKLTYKKGVNPKALFKINIDKDIIIQILRNKVSGTDAFMKGKINIEGSLSQGLRYIKLFRIFVKYLKKKNGFQ